MRLRVACVENVFLRLRWPDTDGKPICPDCDCAVCYAYRRLASQLRRRCKACRHDVSITLFAWHKLPLRTCLLAVVVFCNEVKGKSMPALARDLDVQTQDSVRAGAQAAGSHREAIPRSDVGEADRAASMKGLRVDGEGQAVEIDGAYFGGRVRPENRVADRVDRRLAGNKPGKRRVVVAMRERGGRTLTQVFAGEDAAVPAIRQRIARGTVVHAGENPAWNLLPTRFAMRWINHQHGYSVDGACTNGAESCFSRLPVPS